MKQLLLVFSLFIGFSTFSQQVAEMEIDPTPAKGKYGFNPKSPIKVGGGEMPTNMYTYLKRLKGPNGESVHYKKVGKGPTYENPDPKLTRHPKVSLTMVEIRIQGEKNVQTVYFDQYRYEKPMVLKGYTWQK